MMDDELPNAAGGNARPEMAIHRSSFLIHHAFVGDQL
jgi:hypothetical protein